MSNLLKSKILLGVMIVAVLVVGFAVVKTASATDCTLSGVTLRVGSTGADVICLQTKLAITADGSFGPLTKAAVIAFQTDNALTADGVVGANTRAALTTASIATVTYPAGCASLLGFSSTTGLSCATVSTYPAGCTSATGYSTTTGLSCATVSTYPAGCTSATGYSTTTGLSCATASTLPAGCTSTAGYSPTTGVACTTATTTTYPAGCTSAAGYSSTTGLACTTTTTVVGTGSVDSYVLASSYNNKEVGEGLNDITVAGLEIEVGSGSDLTLGAVKLVFLEGTATSNFDNYADEVSVWLGSTEVGRVDASLFTDDNAWTSTVTLTNAKVLAGATGTLYVKVSGINNLDTLDAADTWTVDYTQVRWTDGLGVTIAEDPATGLRTFSFETSAVATNTELKISSDVAAVNDAHIIDIHATNSTDDVSILSFKIKVEGTASIKLKDLPVNIDVVTQDNVDEMVEGLSLWMDGVELVSSNLTTDCVEEWAANGNCTTVGADETYVFEDIDKTLAPGTYHFLVKADIYGVTDTGDVAVGDTIAANFGETQTDLANWDAEDSTGTNMLDDEVTGTVTGIASIVRDSGINLTLYGTPTAVVAKGEALSPDIGTYTITFDVTAFGANVYIDGTKPTIAGTNSALVTIIPGTGGTGTQDATITSSTGAVRTGTINTTARFLVEEDTSERFTVTSVITPTVAGGLYSISLDSIDFAITDIDITDATTVAGTSWAYVTNLADFVSPGANLVLVN